MHCQFHSWYLSPRACTINFIINSLGHGTVKFTISPFLQGHALSISLSIPKDMHCQFHSQSLSPRACTINFIINSLGHGTVKFTISPFLQGHALSISLSIPKDMHCQFHSQSLSPRACTINITISSLGHALSILQSVPISKGMH